MKIFSIIMILLGVFFAGGALGILLEKNPNKKMEGKKKKDTVTVSIIIGVICLVVGIALWK